MGIIISLSYNYLIIIVSLSHHYLIIILSSSYHYLIIILSLSYHYLIIILSLSYHYLIIISSLSYQPSLSYHMFRSPRPLRSSAQPRDAPPWLLLHPSTLLASLSIITIIYLSINIIIMIIIYLSTLSL